MKERMSHFIQNYG
jgi:hypothetical protein